MSRWFLSNSVVLTQSGKIKSSRKIDYTIKLPGLNTFSTAIGYTFTYLESWSELDFMIGKISAATQKVLNHFPRWTKMRIDPSSHGYKFVSSFGQNLEHVYDQITTMRNESFLSTADLSQTSKLYKIGNEAIGRAVRDITVKQQESNRNILNNSDFSIRLPSRTNKAFGWHGVYSLSTTRSISGSHSVKLSTDNYIAQFVENITDTTSKLTFSFYHYTNSSVSTLEENIYGAFINLIYTDHTEEMIREPITPKTIDRWERFSLTIQPSKRIAKIKVQIILRDNSYITESYIDCLQLEVNDKATSWVRRTSDVPWYISSVQVPRIQVSRGSFSDKKINVWLINDEYKFQYGVPPTRIEYTSINYDAVASENTIWSRLIDYTKEEWPTKWSINSNTLKRENLLVPGEYLFSYDLAEIAPERNKMVIYDDLTRTLLCLTIYKDLLYILCKEVYSGTTKYYLKTVNPFVSLYTKTHLEVMSDIEIDLAPWISNLYPNNDYPSGSYEMGILEGDRDKLAIRLPDGNVVLYNMSFDYGFLDRRKAILYLREDYTSQGLLVSVL